MESSSPETAASKQRRTFVQRGAARPPLVARKRIQRHVARVRIAARTRHGLLPVQQAFDPLARPGRSLGRRSARLAAAIVGSLLIHAAAVGVGFSMHSKIKQVQRDEVKIEVRQRPPQPPPEPPPPPIEKPARTPPKIVKAPPPLPPPPTNVPKPVRIVGLSLESTTEGGDGPAFAVGNTRQGETAERAIAPKDVSPVPAAVPDLGPRSPARSNQIATHIPVAGVVYGLPQPRDHLMKKPLYPETLKSQGIEAEVMVKLEIDTAGKVTAVKILKPSLYPEFDENARKVALTQDFDPPATRNGVPMPYSLTFTYKYRLEDQ